MMNKIKAGIIGGAGYTGGELIRLLLQHPAAELSYVQSNSQAGLPLHQVHTDLLGDTELQFQQNHHFDVDVIFFCSGHGEAKKFASTHHIPASVKLIDLGNDFRLSADAQTATHRFVYGLPELNRKAIKEANAVANPGCFATTIQLGLLPLAQAGLLNAVYTTGITGSTGAGQSLSTTGHFSWRASNIQAYKTLSHQHNAEILQSLRQLQPNGQTALHFVPWRGDFTRGIFVSSTVSTDRSFEEIQSLYTAFYGSEPFTHISAGPVHLKQVVNTNKCIIGLEQQGDMLVVHSVLDNLLKGASGQAVQNMNLLFGMPETMGLLLKGSAF